MRIDLHSNAARSKGFTLTEIVITLLIAVMLIAGVLYGYLQSARNLAWATNSLQAQFNAMSQMEITYSVVYKPQPPSPNDQLVSSNFPPMTAVNVEGTNYTYISTNLNSGISNQFMKMVRVDCVWLFQDKIYTNSVSCLRAPDP